jgi:dipeptidase E
MKTLLTSSGISNPSINDALVELLGKPIAESRALVIPTAIYPHVGGPDHGAQMIRGQSTNPFAGLEWKTVGILELTALPSIDRDLWVSEVQQTDALLVWGGDAVYLSYWLHHSGLADLLPTLSETVYVGVSAGAISAATTFGETYRDPSRGSGDPLSSDEMVFSTPQGDVTRTLVMAHGVGLVDFAVIPHYDNEQFPDASIANAPVWAAKLPVPSYAIDDQSAIKVVDGTVEVISEGNWRYFTP